MPDSHSPSAAKTPSISFPIGKIAYMRLILLILLFGTTNAGAYAQKMLLLERANRAKTTRLYVGQTLRYRLGGEEFWYTHTITDVLPASQSVMLDNQLIRLADIDRIRRRRAPLSQLIGAASLTFGATLAIANTVSLLRDNPDDHGTLYATSGASATLGLYLLSARKLKMGKKFRLRAVEISF